MSGLLDIGTVKIRVTQLGRSTYYYYSKYKRIVVVVVHWNTGIVFDPDLIHCLWNGWLIQNKMWMKLNISQDHVKLGKNSLVDGNKFLMNKSHLWMHSVFPSNEIYMHRIKFCLWNLDGVSLALGVVYNHGFIPIMTKVWRDLWTGRFTYTWCQTRPEKRRII